MKRMPPLRARWNMKFSIGTDKGHELTRYCSRAAAARPRLVHYYFILCGTLLICALLVHLIDYKKLLQKVQDDFIYFSLQFLKNVMYRLQKCEDILFQIHFCFLSIYAPYSIISIPSYKVKEKQTNFLKKRLIFPTKTDQKTFLRKFHCYSSKYQGGSI